MYNQPVMTDVKEASALIENEPTLIYWIFVEAATLGTKGTVKIRDGTSTNGKEMARIVAGYNLVSPFYPPIRCAMGVYVEKDAAVTSYTIGYLPERVAKGQQF